MAASPFDFDGPWSLFSDTEPAADTPPWEAFRDVSAPVVPEEGIPASERNQRDTPPWRVFSGSPSFPDPAKTGLMPEAPQPSAPSPRRRRQSTFAPDIDTTIETAARQHGVDSDLLRTFARIESGGRPDARTGSYKGLFQLSDDEFTRHGGSGDIFDPVANTNAAAIKLKAESADFARRYGHQPSAAELYMVHQQGVGGADRHFHNPDDLAWKNMAATAEGREKGERWAKRAIWGNVPDDMKARFGSVDNITSRDFLEMWKGKVERLGGGVSVASGDSPSPVATKVAPRESGDLLRAIMAAPPEQRPQIVKDYLYQTLGVPKPRPQADQKDDVPPWEMYSDSRPPWEVFGGEPKEETPAAEEEGFFSGLWKAISTGTRQTGASLTATGGAYAGSGKTVESAAEYADLLKKEDPSALKRFSKQVERDKITYGDTIWGGIKNVASAAYDNPEGVLQFTVQQLPNMGVAMGAGLAGAGLGALTGPLAPIAAPVGFIAGMFLGNTALETGGKAIEKARDGATDDELAAARKEGAVKGGIITAVDTATLGLGRWVLGTASRAVERATAKVLTDNGIDAVQAANTIKTAQRQALEASRGLPKDQAVKVMADATVDAMRRTGLADDAVVMAVRQAQDRAIDITNKVRNRIARYGGAVSLQGLGEGAGELFGEFAATGEWQPTDAVLEALAGLVTGPAEIEAARPLSVERARTLTRAFTGMPPPAEAEGTPSAVSAPTADEGSAGDAPAAAKPSTEPVVATPTPPPAPAEEAAILRAQGWTDEEIADMDPAERAEEVAAARSQGVTPQPLAPDQPSAEPSSDLVAQARDLANPENPRRGLYVPRSSLETLLNDPDGANALANVLEGKAVSVDNFDNQGGMLVVPDDATAEWAVEQKDSGRDLQEIIGELTGAGRGKPADGTHAVQQVTPDGAVTRESLVTADEVAATEQAFQVPGRDVRTVAPEEALRRREEEIAAQQAQPTAGDGSRQKPVKVRAPEDIERAGERVQEPTEAQAESGNYRHGHLDFQGLQISVETPKGGTRRGVKDGREIWRVENMPASYGYFKGVPARAKDKEHVDVYVGDNVQSDRAFIVDQHDLDGAFDEPKVVIGVNTVEEAAAIYDAGFSDSRGPERRRAISEVSLDELKEWLQTGDATKPFSREAEPAEPAAAPAPAPAGEVPTFDEIMGTLPEDENGDPDVARLLSTIRDLTGKTAWNQLTDAEKLAVWGEITGEPVPDGADTDVGPVPEPEPAAAPVEAAEAPETGPSDSGAAEPPPAKKPRLGTTLDTMPQEDKGKVKKAVDRVRGEQEEQPDPAAEVPAEPAEPEPAPAAQEAAESAVSLTADERALGQAILDNYPGHAKRLMFARLRLAVPSLSKQQFDRAILSLQAKDLATLYQIDNRVELTDEDRAAAVMVGTQPRHFLLGDAAQQASLRDALQAAERPAEPVEAAPEHWLDSLTEPQREAVRAEMRRLSDEAMKAYEGVPGSGQGVAVGAGDFDFTIKGLAYQTFVSELGNGASPEMAEQRTLPELRKAVEAHNKRRPRDKDWGRAPEFGHQHAELARARIESALREAEAAPEPAEAQDQVDPLAPIVVVLRGAGFKTIVEARKFVKEAGIVPEDASNKQIDETIESAVVAAARQIVAEGGTPTEIYQRLVELYGRQPNLGTRTSTSVANQAYSTPVPLAYIASRLARVATADVVYEPTAGNGALLIEAGPGNDSVHANELDPVRAAELERQGFTVTTEDATDQAHVEAPADAIVMNPPFGAVREGGQSKDWTIDGWITSQVDHAIALQSLKAMTDDGRAVLILGGVKSESVAERRKGYRGKAKREFYFRLYNQYNVTDHFTVDGDLYAKQGAGWPVDVIVIEGKGKSARALPAAQPPAIFKDWDSLAEKLPDATATAQTDAAEAGRPVEPSRRPAGEVGRAPGRDEERGPEAVRGRPERLLPDTGDDAVPVRGDGDRGQPGDVRGGRRDELPAVSRPDPDTGRADKPAAAERVRSRVKRDARGGQATYEPVSSTKPLETLIPVNMADAARAAMERIEQRHGSVDEFVADRLGYDQTDLSKYFGAEQIDAIAAAIDNIERGAAFVTGDQTGVGKGRINAGVLRYAMRRGKIPVLITQKPNLYGDMWRDLRNIGVPEMLGREPRVFITNVGENVPVDDEALAWKEEFDAAKEAGRPTPKRRGQFLSGGTAARQQAGMESFIKGEGKYDIIFTTYDQLNTIKGGKTTPRRQFFSRIASNALFSMDESHEAGGSGQGGWKTKNAEANRSQYVRQLAADAWGVMFSSATYAKRPDVMDLYARTDMGKAVDDPKMLPELIAKGGVPMQQIVATMLADSGQYMRRERSFEGVEYAVEGVPVNPESYRQFSDAIRAVFQFDLEVTGARDDIIKDALDAIGSATARDAGVGKAAASTTAFASVMHNIVNQMLLSIKTNEVAKRAIAAHKAGEKPVIGLSSTMEAFITDFAAGEGITVGETIDLSFRDVLARYLRRTLRVTIKHPDGKKEHKDIPVSSLPAPLQRMYRDALDTINDGDYEGLPVSPIDAIRSELTKAGLKVAEITGRQTMIDYSESTPRYVARPKREMGPSGKRGSISAFNRGALDALIINRSGSTGVSMHASATFRDQKRRRMILAQAEGNIDTHLQLLGRVHRTGQVVPPAYSQIAAEIPAEARPTAVLMKKMASLNANTTGARGSVFMSDAVDFINEVGDRVVANIVEEDPEIAAMLGDPLKTDNDGKAIVEDAAKRVTGRLTLLTPEKQAELLDRISSAYKSEIAQLDALGENPLEAKTLDLQARTLDSTEIKPKQGDSPFLEAVSLEKVSVKAQGRAMAPDEVARRVAETLKAEKPGTDPASSLGGLERQGQDWARETWRTVGERARNWISREVAETSDQAKASTGSRHQDTLARWRATLQVAYPGARVRLGMPAGDVSGVVLKVERTGKAKNPVALGSWEVRIAVPDSDREYIFPMSKLFPPGITKSEDEKGATIERDNTSFADLMPKFEEARREGRENRFVFTGNILAAYDQTAGRGRIINFTTESGELRPGILMGREFSQTDFMESRKVRFQSGEQVAQFLARVPDAEIKSIDDLVTLRLDRDGLSVVTPASRATGGRIYTDPDVRRAVGVEFERRSNQMVARGIPSGRTAQIVDAIRGVGAIFETRESQEVAQEIVGTGVAEPGAASLASLASVADPRRFTPEFIEAIPDFQRALRDEIGRMLPPGTPVHVVSDIVDRFGYRRHGETDVASGAITLSLFYGRLKALKTGKHEVVHVLRSRGIREAFARMQRGGGLPGFGLYTDKEWALLVRRARETGVGAHITIPDADGNPVSALPAYREMYTEFGRNYGLSGEPLLKFVDELMDQELVAAMSEVWKPLPLRHPKRVDLLLARLRNFLQGVWNALNGRGFHTEDDIFERQRVGDIGRRATGQGPSARMRALVDTPARDPVDRIKARMLLRQPVDLSQEAETVLGVLRAEAPPVPGLIRETVVSAIKPRKGKPDQFIVTVRDTDGAEYDIVERRDDILRSDGLFDFLPDGTPFIAFFDFDLRGDFVQRLRGKRAHEWLHGLRALGHLPGRVSDAASPWGRLVRHADSLGVMEGTLYDHLTRIKHPRAENVRNRDTTIFETYHKAYSRRKDYREAMDQESVAHMIQQYVHGVLSEQDVAPVRDVLDRVLAGGTRTVADPIALGRVAALVDTARADLDMSLEARKARAEALGFDTSRDLWHGAGRGWEGTEFREPTLDWDTLGPAIYLTSHRVSAEHYADGFPVIGPLWIRGNIVKPDTIIPWQLNPDGSVKSRAPAMNVLGMLTLQLTSGRYEPWGRDLSPAEYTRQYMKRRGVDAYDSGAGLEIAVYDRRNIRLADAAFDPAEERSADLSASLVPQADAPPRQLDPETRRTLSRDLTEAANIVGRIAGKEVEVQFFDQIPADIAAGADQRAATERMGIRARTAGGFYQRSRVDANALIGLATNDPAYDLRTNAGHEAWHHVEEALATDPELRLIRSPSEMARTRRLAAAEIGMDPADPRLDNLPDKEVRAIAAQRYRRLREEGAQPSGIHIGVRRLWDRIIRIFRAVQNVLSRNVSLREALAGAGSTEAIFERARRGEFANRVVRRTARGEQVVLPEGMASIIAFHGSPHNFDPEPGFPAGRFRMDRLGTGHGDNWQGQGHYFAEQEDLGIWYMERLGSRFAPEHPDGTPADLDDPAVIAWWETNRLGSREEATRLYQQRVGRAAGVESFDQKVLSVLASDERLPDLRAAGHLYEVRIGAEPEQFLDFNKPLSEQNPSVLAQLRAAGLADDLSRTGADIVSYHQDELRRAGIPGVSYVDQGSRNYVVFDDSLIEIVGKDGKPVTAAQRQAVLANIIPNQVQPQLTPQAVIRRGARRTLSRVMNATDRARVKAQDKVLPIRRYQEQLERETGTKLPVNLDVYLAEALYHGRAGERMMDLRAKFIEPLMDGLRAAGIQFDQFGDYLYARHAAERNAAIRKIDPDNDAGSGMTDDEAAAILSRVAMSGQQAQYDEAAAIVDGMLDETRNVLLRAGLIDRETYDDWKNKYQSYVPLRGFEITEDESSPDFPRVGRGFDVRGPEAFRALGRRSKADNPVLYAVMQAQQAIVRAEKNRVDKTLYRQIQAHPDPSVWKIYKGERKRRVNPETGLAETYWVPPSFVHRDNIHGVKIGGKQHWIEIKHAGLARAVRGVGSEIQGTILGRAMFKAARTYAGLLTSYNPEFLFSNFFRDVQTALVNVSDVAEKPEGTRRKIVKEALSLKSIRGALAAVRDYEGRTIFGTRRAADETIIGMKKSQASQEYARWYEEFRQAGGKISFMEYNDVQKIRNDITRSLGQGRTMRALRNTARLVEDLNTAVENGVRLSVYKTLRENGVAQDRAAFVARELTVNFNRKGEWGPTINAAYLFFNASVQGTTRIAQALTRSKAVRWAVGSIFATGLALDLINFLIAGDDDDGENAYDKIPDWVKERNLIVMIPGDPENGYIQIPLAYGYNVPFLAGQKAMGVIRGVERPHHAAATVAVSAWDAFNPMGSAASFGQFVAPTFLDPVVQVLENKTWYGAPIFPQHKPKHQPWSETFQSSAPEWAIEVARIMNQATGGNQARSGLVDISPDVLEHYLEFAMGGVGKFVLNAVNSGERVVSSDEWLPEKTPFVRRLFGKTTTVSRYREFYEAWDEVDAAFYEVRTLSKEGDREGATEARREFRPELTAYPMMKAANKSLRDMRKIRARIEADGGLSSDEKRKRVEEIRKKENALILRALRVYGDARKDAARAPASEQ